MSLSFLRELYSPYPQDSGQLCEIRTIDTDGVVACRYFGLHKLDRAAAFAKEQAPTTNVYMGVLPRFVKESGGGGGRDYHVNAAAWLWCDIDRGDATQSEVVDFLRHKHARLPHPRMIVLSGSGGVHLYWRLAATHSMASSAERDEYSRLLKRLVAAVGFGASNLHADKSCTNVSRILRVPGTLNHKFEQPRPVQAILCEDATDLSFQEWGVKLPFEPMPVFKTQPARTTISKFDKNSIPPGLQQWAATGYPEGKRHHDLIGAAAFLCRDVDLPEHLKKQLFLTKAQNSPGRRPITEQEINNAWKWAGGHA